MKRDFTHLRTSPTQQALIAAIIVMVLNGLLFITPVYRMVGADAVLWINSLTNVAAALISVWLGFRLWRSFQRGEVLGTIWGSLTIGMILWTIAEIIWDSYQFLSDTKFPRSSPADIAWIPGYLAIIVGLTVRLHTLQMRPTKLWQFAVLAIFGALGIPLVIYVIAPILNDARTSVPLEKFIILFYLVGDLVLAFLALLLLLVLNGGLLSRPWLAIAFGCFCVAMSDLLYTFAISQGIYQESPTAGLDLISYVINTSYTFAYVLLTLGLYLQARLQDAI
jgi:hypothetical protein